MKAPSERGSVRPTGLSHPSRVKLVCTGAAARDEGAATMTATPTSSATHRRYAQSRTERTSTDKPGPRPSAHGYGYEDPGGKESRQGNSALSHFTAQRRRDPQSAGRRIRLVK